MKPVDQMFPGRDEAIAQNKCFGPTVAGQCEGDGTATEWDDELSFKEYMLTGLCQKCQDKTYAYLEEIEGQEEPDPTEYVQRLSDEDLQQENASILSYLGENGPNLEFETDPYNQAVRAEVKRRKEKLDADHSDSYRSE